MYDDSDYQFVRTSELRARARRFAMRTVGISALSVVLALGLLVWRGGTRSSAASTLPSQALHDAAVDLAVALRGRVPAPAQIDQLRAFVKIALAESRASARRWSPVLLPALGRAALKGEYRQLIAHLDPESGIALAMRRRAQLAQRRVRVPQIPYVGPAILILRLQARR